MASRRGKIGGMNIKLPSALLFIAAGVIATVGTVGAQIANAISQAGFYSAGKGGTIPPGPELASAHGLVIIMAAILVVAAVFAAWHRD